MRLDKEGIKKLIPHREPFLFLDEIEVVSENKVTAFYLASKDKFFFSGHFPGNPVMPGVLIVEAMAQASLVAANLSGRFDNTKTGYFGSVKAKFRNKILPDDLVRMEIEIYGAILNGGKARSEAYVGDALSATSDACFILA